MRRITGILIILSVLILVAQPVAAKMDTPCGGTHIVQRGETLSSIAMRYGVNMWTLAQANGIINPNHVYVGQRLTIPGGVCTTPAPSGRTHIVQRGENLNIIARRYGVSIWAISQANGLRNLNLLYTGQRLIIPGTAPAPAPKPATQPVTSSGTWHGEYYKGTTPEGGPILTRNSKSVNFHWELSSPDSRIPCDQFSARWSNTIKFKGGVYRFTLTVDDGARIWVDDQQVLDVWKIQPETTHTFDVTLTSGEHTLTIEYFEDTGRATAQFSFKRVGDTPPSPPAPSGDTNWQASYYENKELKDDAVLTLEQPTLDFNWGTGAPFAEVPADHFSARWTRNVGFEERTYAFCAKADDGVRVWVDDYPVLDEWHISDGGVTSCRDLPLSAGLHVVRVEYYEETNNARVKVWWEKK